MNSKQSMVGSGMVLLISAGLLWVINSVPEHPANFVQKIFLIYYAIITIIGFCLIFKFRNKKK